MSSKPSRDQKRKAKLKERERKSRAVEVFQPYSGRKYHEPRWVPVVFGTERAVYETILESNHTLTNEQVQQGYLTLIEHLHRGGPAALGDDEPEVAYSPPAVVERMFYNVRRAWKLLVESGRELHSADLIGILRTLLQSVETQGRRLGASRGYVAFLEDFIPELSGSADLASLPLYEKTLGHDESVSD